MITFSYSINDGDDSDYFNTYYKAKEMARLEVVEHGMTCAVFIKKWRNGDLIKETKLYIAC